MLLIAAWSWWLGGLAKSNPRATMIPGIVLIAYQIGGLALSLLYFPLPAVVFSALLPILYAFAVARAAKA